MKCDFLLLRILSVFNLLKQVGFALLLVGVTLSIFAQPYEPTFLLDVTGEINQRIGAFYLQALGDQNGDGLDDILTTIRSSQNSVDLRVYYGNNANEEDFIDFGRFDTTNDRYGWSDAAFDAGFTIPSGDLNGDGFQDILASHYRQSAGTGYRPVLFLGGLGIFDTIPDWTGTLTDLIYITNVGDYNGDGKDDFTRRPLNAQFFGFYLGRELPLSQIPEWEYSPNSYHMGFGDLNRDGFSDFGISYSLSSEDLSRMDIFLGSPSVDSVPALEYEYGPAPSESEKYGRIVGDINGDDYDDIITSFSSFVSGPHKNVYLGGEDMDFVADAAFQWEVGEFMPRFATPLGDINDDNYDDYAFYEAWEDFGVNKIEVWLGGNPLPQHAAWILEGELDGMNYPYRIGQTGDFNGDGIDDWFFSAYHGLEQRGRIIVVAGDRNFGLAANEPPSIPNEFSLSVFPNPFNSTLSISLDVPLNQDVTLSLYDLLGREVDVVYRGRLDNATLSYTAPPTLASGIYFLRAAIATQTQMQKVVLLK